MAITESTWNPMLEQLHAAIRDRERSGPLEVVETHISVVFLSRRHVYKLKKPVRFEFVDFSTPAAREAACRAELELNRRWADGVYLGVLPVTSPSPGIYRIDGPDSPVDWLVWMKRLDDDLRLDRFLQEGRLSDRQERELLQHLQAVYDAIPPLSVHPADYERDVRRHILANWRDLKQLVAPSQQPLVHRSQSRQLQWIGLFPELLHQRVLDGRIIEGHGDLRPEHIYLETPPAVIDCLEFSSELRRVDVADDLGFLVLESHLLGSNEFAERVRSRYEAWAADRLPSGLWHFYLAYRASVRAKVVGLAPWHAESPRQLTLEAYLTEADRNATALLPPLAVILRGAAGSGKSTLGRVLAEEFSLVHLATDQVRRSLFGEGTGTEPWNTGRFRPESRRRVYRDLLHRARLAAQQGHSVLLDGTFLDPERLEEAREWAEQWGAAWLVVDCRCDEATMRERLARRASSGRADFGSRADWSIAERQRALQTPLDPSLPHIVVDTSESGEAPLQTVRSALRKELGRRGFHPERAAPHSSADFRMYEEPG